MKNTASKIVARATLVSLESGVISFEQEKSGSRLQTPDSNCGTCHILKRGERYVPEMAEKAETAGAFKNDARQNARPATLFLKAGPGAFLPFFDSGITPSKNPGTADASAHPRLPRRETPAHPTRSDATAQPRNINRISSHELNEK